MGIGPHSSVVVVVVVVVHDDDDNNNAVVVVVVTNCTRNQVLLVSRIINITVDRGLLAASVTV